MATAIQGTVNDILQIVSDERGESSVNTDASRIRAVSRAEQECAKRMNWRIFRLMDQTAAGDGSSSSFTIGSAAYPMRPKGLFEVFVGGTTEAQRHSIVDAAEFKVLYNRNNSALLAYEWYDVANDAWKMKVSPTPANGDVITYSYFWVPPTRTAANNAVLSQNFDILARLALAYTYEGEDEDKYKDQLMLAENLINDEMGKEIAPAPGQLYSMGNPTNFTRPRGIGSY